MSFTTSTSSRATATAAVPDVAWIQQQISQRGTVSVPAVFRTVGQHLLQMPSADERARCFTEIASAFRREHPEAVLALAQRLLELDYRDEIALIAAPLAREQGNTAYASELLQRVSPTHSRRRRLEHQWQRETAWNKAERLLRQDSRLRAFSLDREGLLPVLFRLLIVSRNANDPDVMQALAEILEATVGIAREDARGAFYQRGLQRLNEIIELCAPFNPPPLEPPGRLQRLLQRLRLISRSTTEPKGYRALHRALKQAEGMQAQLSDSIDWLAKGLATLPPPTPEARITPAGKGVLYLTFGSLPHHVNGNTSRTHGLLSAITQEGWMLRGLTRPGFPQTLNEELHRQTLPQPSSEPWENSYKLESVLYTNLRTQEAKRWQYNTRLKFDCLVDAAMTLARRDRPAIIHGASNHLIGAAAIHAAERLGLPGIYELRGMWQLDYASMNPAFAETPEYRQMDALEVDLARRASHVFAISHGIRNHLLARGIAPEKISLLPNGVNPDHFRPGPPKPELVRQLKLEGRTVIGFVGTLSHYEGIATLIDAIHLLRQQPGCPPFAVVLMGNGPAREGVLQQIRTLGLQDVVSAYPTVPFTEVQEYLKTIDIIAIPRPGHDICELVTPIKPFEAMALGKTVVASSVGGLTEIIAHEKTGLIFTKDNVESLAETLQRAISDADLRRDVGAAARDFILKHHDWKTIVRTQVLPVYERLAASRG